MGSFGRGAAAPYAPEPRPGGLPVPSRCIPRCGGLPGLTLTVSPAAHIVDPRRPHDTTRCERPHDTTLTDPEPMDTTIIAAGEASNAAFSSHPPFPVVTIHTGEGTPSKGLGTNPDDTQAHDDRPESFAVVQLPADQADPVVPLLPVCHRRGLGEKSVAELEEMVTVLGRSYVPGIDVAPIMVAQVPRNDRPFLTVKAVAGLIASQLPPGLTVLADRSRDATSHKEAPAKNHSSMYQIEVAGFQSAAHYRKCVAELHGTMVIDAKMLAAFTTKDPVTARLIQGCAEQRKMDAKVFGGSGRFDQYATCGVVTRRLPPPPSLSSTSSAPRAPRCGHLFILSVEPPSTKERRPQPNRPAWLDDVIAPSRPVLPRR